MTFREVLSARGWLLRRDANVTPTHFLLDGGKIAVPDGHAGTFLNLYYNSVLKKENVCLVELKTPVFKLFLDVDARVKEPAPDFHPLFKTVEECALDFFEALEDERMIVCMADPKPDGDGLTQKYGFHVLFPGVHVNAPIAMAFRSELLARLNDVAPHMLHNSWEDAIDDSVYKANGLRALYSHKGANEARPYTPYRLYDKGEYKACDETLPAAEKRIFVHDCSIRVFDKSLTKCRGGQDALADQPSVHAPNGIVLGKSVPLSVYVDVMPKVQAALPPIYATQRFTGVFVTRHAIMLRSSSRFCHNVMREHRTSTIYFCVTKRAAGIYQKCYCRKDDHGCAAYSGPIYALEYDTLKHFFPDDYDESLTEEQKDMTSLPSKKKGSLDSLLKRSRFISVQSTSSKKKKRSS